jgi:hypothetical protein
MAHGFIRALNARHPEGNLSQIVSHIIRAVANQVRKLRKQSACACWLCRASAYALLGSMEPRVGSTLRAVLALVHISARSYRTRSSFRINACN